MKTWFILLLSLTWRPVAGGIGRLYKGVAPCLLRSIPANAVMLFTVDKVRQQFLPTGTHSCGALPSVSFSFLRLPSAYSHQVRSILQ